MDADPPVLRDSGNKDIGQQAESVGLQYDLPNPSPKPKAGESEQAKLMHEQTVRHAVAALLRKHWHNGARGRLS
jgi:hypothetical protein